MLVMDGWMGGCVGGWVDASGIPAADASQSIVRNAVLLAVPSVNLGCLF